MKLSLAVAALLCIPGCSPAPEGPLKTDTSTGKKMAVRQPDSDGLSHVAKLNDRLYRGSQPDEKTGYAELKKMGIKTVICLRYHHDYKEETGAEGMNYVGIPIQAGATATPPSDEQVKLFFNTVLDPEKQPVYFHCLHGKDRTGTMAAIYRIEMDGWTPEEAIEELQEFGYHDWYKDFIQFIRDYTPRGFKKK